MNCPNCGCEEAERYRPAPEMMVLIFKCGSYHVATPFRDETVQHTACREIARLRSELAEEKSEVRRLQGMLMAWPPKPVPTLTREDVKLREASRRRTLGIVMRDEEASR